MIARLLCRIGIHKWDIRTYVHDGLVDDFARCVRHAECRYAGYWLFVNREEVKVVLGRYNSSI